MSAKILFVGIGVDGPTDYAYQPKTQKELNTVFGGNYSQRYFVDATTTFVPLDYPPYQLPLNVVNRTKKNWLFHPTYDPLYQTYNFGVIGGTGTIVVDVYYTPYLDKPDLLFAAKKHLEQVGTLPYVVRCGGTVAYLDQDGWHFEAKFPGKKYNKVELLYTNGEFIIQGLEPEYQVLTYRCPLWDLPSMIENDFLMGISPIRVTVAGTGLTDFWDSLKNGSDGELTPATFSRLLERCTIPAEVTHVVLLTELSSAYIDRIWDHFNDNSIQQRMFIFAAPGYNPTTAAYTDTIGELIPFRHNLVAMVLGDVYTSLNGVEKQRYAVEAAMIGFSKREGFNLTNNPVNARDFTPKLNEADLEWLVQVGIIPLMRYIGNDISIFKGCTSSVQNTFLFSSKASEIFAIAYPYCSQFIGEILPQGKNSGIANTLRNLLTNIQYLKIDTVDVEVRADTMAVNIIAFLPDEILNINFSIKNR